MANTLKPTFSHTRTGILGVNRDTMLINELHLKDYLAKSKPRGYSKPFPGNKFIYGMPYPQDTGGVNEALHGWPGTELALAREKSGYHSERDFVNMNKFSVEAGMVTVPQQDQWRLTHDIKRRVENSVGVRHLKPVRLPPNMVYGMSTRPTTPFFDLIEHKYQDNWIKQRRAMEMAKRKIEQSKRGELLNIAETRTSILRNHQPPVPEPKLWQMKRWNTMGPHLETFRTPAQRDAAFKGFDSSKNASKGTKQGGIYNQAPDFHYVPL